MGILMVVLVLVELNEVRRAWVFVSPKGTLREPHHAQYVNPK